MSSRTGILAVIVASGVLAACGEDYGSRPPTTGALEVTVATTGDAPDPDGYTVTVGGETRNISIDETLTFDDLDEGDHQVELTDIAANCTVAGENPRTVAVSAGATTNTTFEVDCPATILEVTVSTTGDAPDADGYTLFLGSSERAIAVDATTTFTDLNAGVYTVDLRDVAFNCVVAGDNPRDVEVTPGTTATTAFEVSCPAPLAVLDGVRGAGEWDDATAVEAFSGATFYYMNDGLNLYMALEVDDATLGADDQFSIRFDNERDGTFDAGEENLSLSGTGAYGDLHSSATSWAIFDDRRHGAGAAGASGGTNFFEMAHPLNSGDPQDFALAAGATVGYCLLYRMDGVSSSATSFPAGCQFAGDDLGGYAELVVE